MSPLRSSGTRNCSTQARNVSPLIGPSNAQGATRPSCRSAPTKVAQPAVHRRHHPIPKVLRISHAHDAPQRRFDSRKESWPQAKRNPPRFRQT
jgi:hypothetical protein